MVLFEECLSAMLVILSGPGALFLVRFLIISQTSFGGICWISIGKSSFLIVSATIWFVLAFSGGHEN